MREFLNKCQNYIYSFTSISLSIGAIIGMYYLFDYLIKNDILTTSLSTTTIAILTTTRIPLPITTIPLPITTIPLPITFPTTTIPLPITLPTTTIPVTIPTTSIIPSTSTQSPTTLLRRR